MNFVALKMLMGDRAKYLGLIFTIAFASFLLANHRAIELANDRYRSGLVDFLDVLEAERSLFTIQAQFTQSEQAVSQNLIRLYKALEGGWDPANASYAGRGY